MLTREENELLTQVGPGTPMGAMMRRYWIPACTSADVQEPDCDPVRVRLLGENLIAFRDSQGHVGILDEQCPHRGVSLFLGRNEEGGVRCIYHGWKMDVEGHILDMPCEPRGSTFRERVLATAYPVYEQGGLVWVYMGPSELRPRVPDFEWTSCPSDCISIGKSREDCNYLQAVEGTVDTNHAAVLHNGKENLLFPDAESPEDIQPLVEIIDTEFGFCRGTWRNHAPDPERFQRVQTMNFVMPFYCVVPPRGHAHVHLYVPIDDEHTWDYSVYYSKTLKIDHEKALRRRRIMPGEDLYPDGGKVRNLANNYLQDRVAMRERRSFSGIGDNPHEDHGVQESMGPIYDRTREHLSPTDTGIVRVRQLLLDSARAVARGDAPIGLDDTIAYSQIRSYMRVLPRELSWQEVDTYPTEDLVPDYLPTVIG